MNNKNPRSNNFKASIVVKSFSILIIASMVLSAVPGLKATPENKTTITKNIKFSVPEFIQQDNQYMELRIANTEAKNDYPGAPALPKYTAVLWFNYESR